MHFKFTKYTVMNPVVTAVVHNTGIVRFAKYAIEGTP